MYSERTGRGSISCLTRTVLQLKNDDVFDGPGGPGRGGHQVTRADDGRVELRYEALELAAAQCQMAVAGRRDMHQVDARRQQLLIKRQQIAVHALASHLALGCLALGCRRQAGSAFDWTIYAEMYRGHGRSFAGSSEMMLDPIFVACLFPVNRTHALSM